ncbi:MAG: galactose-1-phosphate uridylyltransferase [Deltaproteobacteria bacterium]|nr:galactose-1-phosphate uridylyltransferase [Deltaproteobacteria bacterium]
MRAVHPQQSELRRDPFRPGWVILAPGRAARPQPPVTHPLLDDDVPGPFAEGNEIMTPPEVFALRAPESLPNGPGWRVRVVPNLYPALRVEHAALGWAQGPSDAMGGAGAHEVIIEDPDRNADFGNMPVARVMDVLLTWRARLADLRRDDRLQCGVIFRHRGVEAGATQAHPHSQLIALPFIPPVVADELAAFTAYRAAHGRCPLCDVLRHERQEQARLVADFGGALVFAPFAARAPGEIIAAPVDHPGPFEDAPDAVLGLLAQALRDGLKRVAFALGSPPYRMWLRTAPWRGDGPEKAGHHWYVDVAPVTNPTGAFEDAAGVRINTLTPEDAAAALRGAPG